MSAQVLLGAREGWDGVVGHRAASAPRMRGLGTRGRTVRGRSNRARAGRGLPLLSVLAVVAFLGGVSWGLSEAHVGEGPELSRDSVVAIHEGATPPAVSVPQKGGNLTSVAAGVRTVRVLPGDTLWSIAGRTFPDADPRAAVTAFRQANGGQLRSLQVGAELTVPSNV